MKVAITSNNFNFRKHAIKTRLEWYKFSDLLLDISGLGIYYYVHLLFYKR